MIARFLPRRLGQMLMLYLRDVMPFRKLIDLNNFPAHGFLFGNADGHWKTECQTKAMVRETSDHLGFRLTSQEYVRLQRPSIGSLSGDIGPETIQAQTPVISMTIYMI